MVTSTPPSVVKINFDGSVQKDRPAAAVYVIRNFEGKPLKAAALRLNHMAVPMAKIVCAWAGLKAAVQFLQCNQVFLEGDSVTIIYILHSFSFFLESCWSSIAV